MRKPWPDIRQNEAAECGLACLAQIATHHGHHTSLARLRRRYGLSLRGATLQNLITVADGLGLAARPVRFDMEDLGELVTPCVLHWDFNHFVVLIRVDRKGLHIHDPAHGPRTVTRKAASDHLTGVALELTKTSSFRTRAERDRVKLSSFWSSIRGMKRSLAQLAVYALILEIFELIAPLYLQFVVDDAVGKGDVSLVGVLAFGILLVGLFQTVVQYVRSHADLTMSTSISRQMQTNLFTHMLRLPLGWFERRQVGDVVSRFSSLNPIQTSLTAGLINVSLDGLFSLVTLALMIVYSGWLTLVALTILVMALMVRLISFHTVRGLTYEQIDSAAKEDTAFLDVMRSIRPIKAFGREDERGVVWQNAYARLVTSNVKMTSFGIRIQTIESVIWALHGVLILYLGAREITAGTISLGMLLAFQAYNVQFNGRIVALVDELMQFRMLRLHLNRLSDIIQTEREDQRGRVKPLDVDGRIELRDVGYRYSSLDRPVVNGLHAVFEQGSCTAVLGSSGAGKSTLVKLMAGLTAPTSGAVIVDGVDLIQADLRSYRRQIGVVMQDDTLMSGSVLDNIAFFSAEPDATWAEECAKQVWIHEDIVRMPMQYASLVGDHGSALSGGQRQRLLLARALYQRPRVLIVDEGTANLDLETEERVVAAIGDLPITRILITHRPSLLAIADRTLRLDKNGLHEDDPFILTPIAAE